MLKEIPNTCKNSLPVVENIKYSIIDECSQLEESTEKEKNEYLHINERASESSRSSKEYVPEEDENALISDDNQDYDEANPIKIPSKPLTSDKDLAPEVKKRIRKRKATWHYKALHGKETKEKLKECLVRVI